YERHLTKKWFRKPPLEWHVFTTISNNLDAVGRIWDL
ncbi:uncharacterized protein METZ01_LOCUS403547, partial [marine metagenome]